MLNRALEDIRRAVKLEVNLSYRFPVIEGAAAIILFICGIATTSVFSRGPGMNIDPTFGYNGSEAVVTYLSIIEGAATTAFATSLINCTNILIFLVPIFFGFILSRTFEDGTLRTFLSYPISRNMFLISKISLATIFFGALSVMAAYIWVTVLFPVAINTINILWLTLSFFLFIFIMSVTLTLIAVLSRNAAVTTVLGIFAWYATTIIVEISGTPIFVVGVLNPIKAVFGFINGNIGPEAVGEVAFALVAVFAASVALCFAGLKIFSRTEI